MIGIWQADTGYRSQVICDCCGQPIRDASLGVAFFDKEDLPAKHAHKGKCFDAIDSRRGFMELNEHLAQLLYNSVSTATPE
jgi:hypothetical protein